MNKLKESEKSYQELATKFLEVECQLGDALDKVDQLERRAEYAEGHLNNVLNSTTWKLLRPLRALVLVAKNIKIFLRWKNYVRGWQVLKVDGVKALGEHIRNHGHPVVGVNVQDYQRWIQLHDTRSSEDCAEIVQHIETFKHKPLISIVMPVYDVGEKWLRLALDSVLEQLYPHWEVGIADDCSPSPHIRKVLDEYVAKDTRIKVKYREKNGHISECSNSAIELVTGEFIALMDHDDIIPEHALYYVAAEINEHPDVDLIYSDEDKIDEDGVRYGPYFKPDWNIDLFYAQNMFSHLGVYRTSLVQKVDGFRKGYEGSQDYDLVLRCLVHTNKIRHIPHVLYYWRAIEGSTALTIDSKDYCLSASRRAITDYLDKNHTGTKVVDAGEETRRFGYHALYWPIPESTPEVTLIIPTRDNVEVLCRCIESILNKTIYKNYKILVVNNQSLNPETLRYLEEINEHENIKVVDYDHPFNFAAINNWAANKVTSPLLAFINDDVEVIAEEWLRQLVGHALRKDVGVAGAKLYFPDNRVQHAGIGLGMGDNKIAAHLFYQISRQHSGYYARPMLTHSCSAVTAACMVMEKSVFDELGGFDAENLTVAYNDIDLCLKVNQSGRRCVMVADAELFHYESASRGEENETAEKKLRYRQEISYIREKWADQLVEDPYYNPNLDLPYAHFTPAFPPRSSRPWKKAA